MSRRALALLALLGLAACSGEPSGPSTPVLGPSFTISDAGHSGGRPDFAWRPPIANTTLTGTFDGTRQPTVRICELNIATDACGATVLAATLVAVVASSYQYDWMVPVSGVTYYRIIIEEGDPAVILGFADVKTAATSKELKPLDPNEFVGVTDGSFLPIKFRLDGACEGQDCGGGFIDTNSGGTAYYTEDGEVVGGVTITATPGGGLVTVDITPCAGNLPIPNPKFGSCLDVDVEEDEGEPYVGPGVAFICDARAAASEAGLNAAEQDEVTLYRKHGTDPVEALPHADDECPEEVIPIGSVKGLLRALVQRNWKKVGQQLTALIAPTPLYARRLDAGAGGEVDDGFSLFQFAQPCVAGVGANQNNVAADAAFSSGDLDGAICRITEASFNGFIPAELNALFPALIITWNSDPSLNVDWTTRLQPYVSAGGGVIFDGDTKNIADLASIVVAGDTSTGGVSGGTYTVTPVLGLTDGINSSFENNHIEFASWNSALAPFLSFSPDGESTFTVGLYGKFGTGCIVLTGPDQDFHGLRGSSIPEEANQYNLLLNELKFVQGLVGDCQPPAPPILTQRAGGSGWTVAPRSEKPVTRTPEVPAQQKSAKRQIPMN